MEPKKMAMEALAEDHEADPVGDALAPHGPESDEDPRASDADSSRLAYRFAPGSPPVLVALFPEPGARFELESNQVLLIGRDPRRSDLVLLHPSVSQKHCQISIDDDECTIADLGSSNGTFVNGERLTSRRTLRQGDLIAVGRYVFMFLWHSFTVATQAEVLHYRELRALLAQLYPTPTSIQALLLGASLFSLPIDLTRGTADQIWDRILEQLRKQDVLAALDKIFTCARNEYPVNRELRRLQEILQAWKASRQRVGIQERINTEVKNSARVVREILENHMGPEDQSNSLSLMLDEVTDAEEPRASEVGLPISEARPTPPSRGIAPPSDLPFDVRSDDSGRFPAVVPRDPEDIASIPGILGWSRPVLTGQSAELKKPNGLEPPDVDEIKTVLEVAGTLLPPAAVASSLEPPAALRRPEPELSVVEYTRTPSPLPEPQAPNMLWRDYVTDEYVVTVLPEADELTPSPLPGAGIDQSSVSAPELPPAPEAQPAPFLAGQPTVPPFSRPKAPSMYAPEPPPTPGTPPWALPAQQVDSESTPARPSEKRPETGATSHRPIRAPWQQEVDPFAMLPSSPPADQAVQASDRLVPEEEGVKTVWLPQRDVPALAPASASPPAPQETEPPAMAARRSNPAEDTLPPTLSPLLEAVSSQSTAPSGLIPDEDADEDDGPDTARLPAPPWEQNPPPKRNWQRPAMLVAVAAAATAAIVAVNLNQSEETVVIAPPAQHETLEVAANAPADGPAGKTRELPTYTPPVPGKPAPATAEGARQPARTAATDSGPPTAPAATETRPAPRPDAPETRTSGPLQARDQAQPPSARSAAQTSAPGASSGAQPIRPLFEVLNFLDDNGQPKYTAGSVPPGAVFDAATQQISSRELKDCQWIDGRQKELPNRRGKTFLRIRCSAGSSRLEGWVNRVAVEPL